MSRTVQTTVTYLQMTDPPKRIVPLPRGKFAVIRANKPPIHFYRYLYNQTGHDYFWVSRHVMSDDALKAIIHNDAVHLLILYVEGAPAGFAELDLRQLPTVDLSFLGLIPEFLGKGLGQFLLHAAIETAWLHHPEKLTVQTCTLDHPRALPLYQRAGFSPTGQKEISLQVPDGF